MLYKTELNNIKKPPVRGTNFFETNDLCGRFLLSNKKFFFLKKKFKKKIKEKDNKIYVKRYIKYKLII